MCNTSNNVCIPPSPHFPNWSYHCPSRAPNGTDESHRFEMDWDTGHGIIICPDHRGIKQAEKILQCLNANAVTDK